MRSICTCLCAMLFAACSTAMVSADTLSVTNPANIGWGVAGTSAGNADLFPSVNTVSGFDPGPITEITIDLNLGGGTGHSFADDLEIHLVHVNSGTSLLVMKDAGGADDFTGDVTFGDAFGAMDDLTGGNFAGGAGSFGVSVYGVASSGAPAANIANFAGFNGLDANSDWELYVFDDFNGDTGNWAGGWTLNVTTAAIPEPGSIALVAVGALGLAARRRRR